MNEAAIAPAELDTTVAAPVLTRRQRLLRALRSEEVDHAPVWMMRQAGRALPEYRKLKERYTFLQLAQTPELAAEVTLQPIRRFGFDAAIIFSDILVIPEAMGVGYKFRETGGVEMDFTIRTEADIDKLSVNAVVDKLEYVLEAIRLTRKELGESTGLLGFAGSPWTLANFMLDGGSAKEHTAAYRLFHANRGAFEMLCEKLTEAVTQFLIAQIRAGVDAVQIFDSHGGLLPRHEFAAASGVWIREIVASLCNRAPVIVFSKGARDWPVLLRTGADVLGIDHGIRMAEAREKTSDEIGLQGNLPPECLVSETEEQVIARTESILDQMRGRNGHIFNLGHGLLPATNLDNISAVLRTIRGEA